MAAALAQALPDHVIIPAHPVAGTERSGPEAGFAGLFHNRWCILTPPDGCDPAKVAQLQAFWERLGANVELMAAEHHDLVLAITSHLPHLIAYTIVGTADDLEGVTQGEVIKYSAGGFRDFTRIAASDPTMWRDVFLNNREAVLEMLGRFTEDLAALQRNIRFGEGDQRLPALDADRPGAAAGELTADVAVAAAAVPEQSQQPGRSVRQRPAAPVLIRVAARHFAVDGVGGSGAGHDS